MADQQQQQYMHQPVPQHAASPVQPANVYQPAQSPDNIHAMPAQQHQVLPPSYDQAKAVPGAPVQGAPVPVANGVPMTVVPLNMLVDASPQPIDCPFCHQRTMTEIRKEGSSMQILVGALFCLVCVCLTCVPCIAGWFEDAEWRCSQCKNMVARRRHDGPMEVLGPQAAVYSQYPQQAQMVAQPQQPVPVQTKDASAFVQQPMAQPVAQHQQYEMQPQHPQQQYQQQPQQHYQQQQYPQQEIQPVYQQQQYVQQAHPEQKQ